MSQAAVTKGPQAVVTSVVFTTLATVIVALRLLTRGFIIRNFGPEDWTILASCAFSIVLATLVCVEVKHGQGRHIDTIPPNDLEALLKAFWGSVPAYQAALALTKISILAQYLRVFVGPSIHRATWILMGLTIAYGFWSVFSDALMCMPVSYFWTHSGSGHCMNMTAIWFTNAGMNIVLELATMLLPMPVLNQLQLPRRQKFCLMAVFALGGFVCLVSVLRLRALYTVSHSTDITWDNAPAAYWSSVEVNVGLICASLPPLRALVSRFCPRLLAMTTRTDHSKTTARRTFNSRFDATHSAVSNKINGPFDRLDHDDDIELKNGAHVNIAALPTLGKDVEDGVIQVVRVVEQDRQDVSDGADSIEAHGSVHRISPQSSGRF